MVEEIGVISQKDTPKRHSTIESIVEWTIKDFLSLPHEVDAFYNSPGFFSFANESWYLRIYPNGRRWDETEKFIELYLHRGSPGARMKMEITFGVKTVDGKIDYERHYKKDFNGNSCSNSFCLNRSELLKIKSYLLPSDTLTLVCRMMGKVINEVASSNNLVSTKCRYCNKTLSAQEDIHCHLRQCEELPIKCQKCGEDVALKNWYDHKCQMADSEGSSSKVPAKSTYCNTVLAAQEDIQCHLRKCEELLIHCQNCSSGVTIKNWHDHKCQKTDREGFNNTIVTKCSYCHKTLGAKEDIQTHLQECEDLPIKCRKCNDRVALRNWYEHECQMTNAEGKEITPESSEDFHWRTDFEFILAA